jgi:disulfide bond formation protein DsbB
MCKLPLCNCMRKLFSMPYAAWIVLAVGVGGLGAAYCAQYVFDVKACDLCLWQRVPYGLAILWGALALAAHPNDRRSRMFLGLAALTFLGGFGLAIFHTGVEQHWWADAVSCTVKSLKASNIGDMSLNDMRNQLLATVGIPCDEITWSFLGFSMANWNILASLALAIFAVLTASGCCATSESGGACRFCCSCKAEKKDS